MSTPEDTPSFDTREDAALSRLHRARALIAEYNATASTDADTRERLLDDLLAERAAGVWIEPPFFCDYGDNIALGAGVFINTNCVFLDGARITIGEGTLLGPGVQIYATTHPIRADQRMYRKDGIPAYRTSAEPVTIGSNAWIGGGAIILPGVTIGNGTTVGAGSVVNRSLPDNVFAAGNPCRVVRQL
ncbi:MAG: sugar O-acetyltransferase [Rhodobacteraceae bacterium]|nr:sugar O-acetyltransferase [Paracoccaceae bacterium]